MPQDGLSVSVTVGWAGCGGTLHTYHAMAYVTGVGGALFPTLDDLRNGAGYSDAG